jgi:hypothetical protein
VEVVKTVEHIEVVTDNANGWFGHFVEKINGMIEVGDSPEAVNAVIVEEEAKFQVVLEKSKKELPVSGPNETTTDSTDSIAFYDKLQVSIETQVKDIKKTVKETYVPGSEVAKIDIHAVKADFKKAVEVELVEAKTVVYKDAGVTESEVTVIATKPVKHVKHEIVNVCKPVKPVTKKDTVIVSKPIKEVVVVEGVKKQADVVIVEGVKKQADVVVVEEVKKHSDVVVVGEVNKNSDVIVEGVKKQADVVVVEEVKKQSEIVVVEEKLPCK